MLPRAQVANLILNETVSGPEKGEPKGTHHLKAANWEDGEVPSRGNRSVWFSKETFPILAEKIVNKK